MPQEPKANYPCTQQALYSIADTIYGNLEAQLLKFSAYKAKYTGAFITALKNKLTAAKNIPDEEMRNSAFEVLRLQLIPLNNKCAANFQLLKGYINDAYPKDQWETRYEAAGQTYYRNAKDENWEMMVGVNTAMKNFINAELANLTANNNMPAAFKNTVTADSNAFDLKYSAFKIARQTSDETAVKINANNGVYASVVSVCDDGQRIFADKEDTKKMFIFDVVKAIVSPPGSASLKVTVKKASDNTPVPQAVVTIQMAEGVPITLTTDATGVVQFQSLDPADYNGNVVPPAPLNPKTFVKEVNTGTNARTEIFVN